MASALEWCISDWPNIVVERTAHPTCLLGFAHIVEGGPPLTTGVDMIDATVVPKGLIHPTFGATVASIIVIF
jgi:hypothetical protein